MSNITFSTIITNYPVPGQDNDTNGFRQNFQAIYTALSHAHDELADLQAKALLKDKLTVNDSLDNNLANNVISNPLLKSYSGVLFPQNAPGSSVIANFTDGNTQKINVTQSGTSIQITGWPVNNTPTDASYSSILRLMLVPTGNSKTVTIQNTGGTIKVAAADVSTLVPAQNNSYATINLATANTAYVIEAWNLGDTVAYLKIVGVY
jgi:hypothetical protein